MVAKMLFDKENGKIYIHQPIGQDMGGWMAVWDYKLVDVTEEVAKALIPYIQKAEQK